MTLTNKYLQYSPEITFEIFELLWNKLIESGFKSRYDNKLYSEFKAFRNKHNYLVIDDTHFNTVMSFCIINELETTVQEILGYNPFVKEDVIPEYVECIKVATQNTKIGEIFKCRHQNGLFEFEYNNKSGITYKSWDGWSLPWSDELPQKFFKPSTKEAFDAQNKPKQPLKQAVHCTTQEEWDFVTEKFGNDGKNWFKHPDWGNNKSFCISFEGKNQSQTLDFYINAGYQILSFQEWCDLNGYKMESNQKFKVGDWVVNLDASMNYKINEICKISLIEDGKIACEGKPTSRSNQKDFKYFRHATPEEINNHLISIGQIPAGEPLNTGIEPDKDGMFKYKQTMPGASWSGGTIDNHLDVMIPTTGNSYNKDFSTSIIPVKSISAEVEFNFLPEPK